jgi:transposase
LPARVRAQEDALQSLRSLGRQWDLGAHLPRSCRRCGLARSTVHRRDPDQGPPHRRRRKRGGLANGIGRTRIGRQSKIHAVCDEAGRPWTLVLTPGNIPDVAVAQQCIGSLAPTRELVADKGYDADVIRKWLNLRNTAAVIPPMRHRRVQYPYDKSVYAKRNVIERLFCRLKDWRRVATRYDRKASTFIATVTIAAIVMFWL